MNDLKSLRFDLTLTPPLQELLATLSPYTQRIYLVGGCVRDLFLDVPLRDYDIEVYDIDVERFHTLMEKFGAIGVGKAFFVYRKGAMDISLPRVESKVSRGHRGFDVVVTQEETLASQRRDFTINAMMLNLFTGEVLDFYGGRDDLEKRTLRVVSEQTFVEDSLRVLRAVQLCGRFSLKLEEKSRLLSQSLSLADLSKERITAEFAKLDSLSFVEGIRVAFDLGVFEKLLGKQICITLEEREKLLPIAAQAIETCGVMVALLWVLKESYHPNFDTMQKLFSLSKEEIKWGKYQKRVPKHMTDRFLAVMGRNYPLKMWVAAHEPLLKQRVVALGLWDEAVPTIDPHEPISLGLKGGEIGIYIKQKQKELLKTYHRTRNNDGL